MFKGKCLFLPGVPSPLSQRQTSELETDRCLQQLLSCKLGYDYVEYVHSISILIFPQEHENLTKSPLPLYPTVKHSFLDSDLPISSAQYA